MIRAATLSFGQVFDSRFIRVLGISVAVTLALFLLIGVGGGLGITALLGHVQPPQWLARSWGWLDGVVAALGGLGLFGGLLFLFPAVATLVMGALLDDVIDAVEARHYPQAKAPRRLGLAEGGWLGLLCGGRMLLINLALLPVYIVLLITGIGPFILYLLVNGYLLGRDYGQMVALRHLNRADEKQHRAKTRQAHFAIGLLIALIFLVPFVNLLAPLLGAAMATHVFHTSATHVFHSGRS
jgi:CysZ protein